MSPALPELFTHPMAYIVVALFGLVVGSFLNVCIWRIPRGESIISPGSHCPSCNAPIGATQNIPVISYLALGGRCRSCRAGISGRYPLVEALNSALYVWLYARYGMGWHLPVYLAFVSSLIVITFIDLDHQIIPDRITLAGIAIGLLAGSSILPDPFAHGRPLGALWSAVGAASGFLFFYAVAVLSRGGMGGGDVKMMGMVGAVLGWKGVFLTTLVGSLTGTAVGLYLIVAKGGGRKTKVPFGPFLALGSLVSIFLGQEIVKIYLGRYVGP